jgi:hypothetical protein
MSHIRAVDHIKACASRSTYIRSNGVPAQLEGIAICASAIVYI